MQVSIIIVTWNSSAHIAQCLESVQKYIQDTSYEVIVVDNASVDNTAELVEKKFPWVQLIKNTTNTGFGQANNAGAQQASGEILFFLNDDTVLTEDAITPMWKKITNDPSIGALGCHLTFADGSHQDSVRRDPRVSDQIVIITKMHNFFPSLIGHYLASDMDYTQEQDVEQIMGACMMIPASVFHAAGGFDKRFFIWFEEVDLLKTIREKQQKRIVYTPDTNIIHLKGTSFNKVPSVQKQRMFQKSQRRYFFKQHGVFAGIAISLFHPIGLLLSCVVQVITSAGGNIKKWKDGQQ